MVPDFEQKQVDIKIGLDIAWIALKGIAETIVLVSGDSDLIPAMKFARREGVRIILHVMAASVKEELKVHADFVMGIKEFSTEQQLNPYLNFN